MRERPAAWKRAAWLQVCPAYVDLFRQPEGTLREALGQVAAFHAAVRERSDRTVAVRTTADLDAVERDGLLTCSRLEGVEPFGYDVHTAAEIFVELGLRIRSPGTGATRSPTERPSRTTAVSAGSDTRSSTAVELGVVLDLAHASPARSPITDARAAGRRTRPRLAPPAAPSTIIRATSPTSSPGPRRARRLLGLMLLPLVVDPWTGPRSTVAIDHLEHAAR